MCKSNCATFYLFLSNYLIEIYMFASGSMLVDDDMITGDEITEIILNRDLEQQICNAIDPRFLLQLV
jgi:hypothetical protein